MKSAAVGFLFVSVSALAGERAPLPGYARVEGVDYEHVGGQFESVLVFEGQAAWEIQRTMTRPKRVQENLVSCATPEGKLIQVKVLRKSGVTFTCTSWPAECAGGAFYRCEAILSPSTGAAEALY